MKQIILYLLLLCIVGCEDQGSRSKGTVDLTPNSYASVEQDRATFRRRVQCSANRPIR